MALWCLLISTLVVVPMIRAHPAAGSYAVHRHAHRRADEGDFDGGNTVGHRDIIVYDASVEEPTRVPEVVVWVNDAGDVVCTVTESVLLLPTRLALPSSSSGSGTSTGLAEATTTTTMTWLSSGLPVASSSSATVGPGGEETSSAAPSQPPTPVSVSIPTSSSSEASGASQTTADGPTSLTTSLQTASTAAIPSQTQASLPGGGPGTVRPFGISYAPYRADNQCKSRQDIDDDFRRFGGSYGLVRIYGTDCDQVRNVYSAAKANGVKLFLGIWDIVSVLDEANKIIAGIKGDWGIVHTISVGNESVNSGRARPDQVLRALRAARAILRAAGYTGPVVTVDTFIAVKAHPQLCDESDYCAINAHPFFDSTISAPQAGRWLLKTVKQVQSVLSTPKQVVVTETGWPTRGTPNGLAVPGMANQKTALESIKEAFASNPGDIILFSAFNDLWKKREMATFNADQYWGIDGAVSNSDQWAVSSL